jgi:hypothetical protein
LLRLLWNLLRRVLIGVLIGLLRLLWNALRWLGLRYSRLLNPLL